MIGQSPFEQKITTLAQEALAPSPYFVWGLTYQQSRSRALLRIFIESEQGICLDDCEDASRRISVLLDVADVIGTEYLLEVSSPGLDRILFSLEQMQAYQNEQVTVTLYQPVNERKRLQGTLISCADDAVEMSYRVDGGEQEVCTVPMHYIKQMRLRTQF